MAREDVAGASPRPADGPYRGLRRIQSRGPSATHTWLQWNWRLLAREMPEELGPVFIKIELPSLEELSDQSPKIVTGAKYRYILPA